MDMTGEGGFDGPKASSASVRLDRKSILRTRFFLGTSAEGFRIQPKGCIIKNIFLRCFLGFRVKGKGGKKMVARHHMVIIILAVLLAASIIGLFFLYPPYQSTKQALQECQRRLSEQDKKVAALSEDQIKQVKSTYEALVSTLKEEIKKQEVTIKDFEEAVSLTFIDRILFEFGKATLTPEGEKILEKVGAAVKNVTEKRIRVTGHADNVRIHPDFKYLFPTNWELSGARAASVVRYFQQKADVDPKDMEAVGRSFYQPVASNETKEGRAQNRRVEIFIAPQMEIKRK